MVIDDINHPTILQIVALRDRRERDRTGLFFCEGARFLIQASAQNAVEQVIATPEILCGGPLARYIHALKRKGIEPTIVEQSLFERLSLSKEPSGVGVIARQRWQPLPSPKGLTDGCWISFDQVQSPGNLGSIMRTCDAVGASGALFVGRDVDPYDPGAVRGSMGSIFSQPLTRTSWHALRSWSRAARVLIVGTSPHAERDYREVSYRRPVVLAMGWEREGLSQERLAQCDAVVRIPMVGGADSLNVAVAASIMLYEVFGQRTPAGRPKRLAFRRSSQSLTNRT